VFTVIETDSQVDAPFQRLSRSENGENLLFTLSAHIARPSWGFDGLNKDNEEGDGGGIAL
jgi:hypothetical protein